MGVSPACVPDGGKCQLLLPCDRVSGSCRLHDAGRKSCLGKPGIHSSIYPVLSVEVSRLKPYAFTNMFRGPANVWAGETFKGWTFGTVPWAMRAMTHYMLGIRPDYDALLLDPVWPKHWDRVAIHRQWRGFDFEMELLNLNVA